MPGLNDYINDTINMLNHVSNVVIVVDIIKGLKISDKLIIQECIRKNKNIIYVLNKIDWVILELQLSPDDAYLLFEQVVNDLSLND